MGRPSTQLEVAIIGGGLCGLALACALSKRSIPYKIYEARSSFQELGAGINIGPNTSQAFRLIDEPLADAFFALSSGNPPGKEEVFVQMRCGVPTDLYSDAALLTELMAPPIGNRTVGRNELLQMLAEKAGMEHAVFDKKLVAFEQDDQSVRMQFADGSEATASVLIACDGIHSAVRAAMLPPNDPAAYPKVSGHGAYRTVLPVDKLEAAVGSEMARTSLILLGPDAYIIMYPMDHGKHVNVGFWCAKPNTKGRRGWMVPNQGAAMRKYFARWGETVHRIMDLMGNPPFFATHHHSVQPESCWKGRVCFIGDAAHAMPPHLGAGAGQAIEDAFVMSEILQAIGGENFSHHAIEKGFQAYDAVRQPRSQRVLEASTGAFDFWTTFGSPYLQNGDIEGFVKESRGRIEWIWNVDLAAHASEAVARMGGSMEIN